MTSKTSSGEGDLKNQSPNMPAININISSITAASRIYIVEHLVVHLSLILLVVSGIGLYNSVIDHFMNDNSSYSVFAATLSFEQLALYIAMALVALPVFVLFYTRTRKAERAHPELFQSRARRRLIYLALSIAALFMLGYAIGFVYTTVLSLINAETNIGGESWLHSSLKQLFALAYIGLVAYFVSRLTSGIDEGGK